MAAITPTKKYGGELAYTEKVKVFTVAPGSASDTIDLSAYFDTIHAVVPVLNTGMAAALQSAHATFSGTSVTLVTKGGDGNAASAWSGTQVTLIVFGTDEGI